MKELVKYVVIFLFIFSSALLYLYIEYVRVPKENIIYNFRKYKNTYYDTIYTLDSLSSHNIELHKIFNGNYHLSIYGTEYVIYDGKEVPYHIFLKESNKVKIVRIINHMKTLDINLISKSKSGTVFRVGNYFPNQIAEIKIYNQNQDFTGHSNVHKIEDNVFLETGAYY